jgi:hypothetical protein
MRGDDGGIEDWRIRGLEEIEVMEDMDEMEDIEAKDDMEVIEELEINPPYLPPFVKGENKKGGFEKREIPPIPLLQRGKLKGGFGE